MLARRVTSDIVIHGAYTPPSLDVGVEEIREWHLARGWSDIGYHFVIRRDATIEAGRDVALQGAHVANHNYHTIGICLVGGKDLVIERWQFNYTFRQMIALGGLIGKLLEQYPSIETILGHRDYPEVTKDCPGFDVAQFFGRNGQQLR